MDGDKMQFIYTIKPLLHLQIVLIKKQMASL